MDGLLLKVVHPKLKKGGLEAKTYMFIRRIWGGQVRPSICAQAWGRLFRLQEVSFLDQGWPLDALFLNVVHPKRENGRLEAKICIFISRTRDGQVRPTICAQAWEKLFRLQEA